MFCLCSVCSLFSLVFNLCFVCVQFVFSLSFVCVRFVFSVCFDCVRVGAPCALFVFRLCSVFYLSCVLCVLDVCASFVSLFVLYL